MPKLANLNDPLEQLAEGLQPQIKTASVVALNDKTHQKSENQERKKDEGDSKNDLLQREKEIIEFL